MKIYALIKSGLVINTIKADDNFISIINNQYDEIIDVTEYETYPSIGYVWDGTIFIDTKSLGEV